MIADVFKDSDFKLGLSMTQNLIPFIDKQGLSSISKLSAAFTLVGHYMGEAEISDADALLLFLGMLERRHQ